MACIVRWVFVLVVVAALAWLGRAYVTRERIYEKAANDAGNHEARIIWQRVFPYYQGVDVYLVVVDANGEEVLRRPMLRFLNQPDEVEKRISGLKWDGDEILLTKADVQHWFSFQPGQ